MNDLEQQLAGARRRLYWVRFQTLLAFALLVGLGVASFALFLDKMGLVVLADWREAMFPAVHGWILGIAVVSAVLVTFFRTLWRRISMQETALRVDEALGLRERLVSSLHIQHTDHPMRDMIVADARARAEHIPVTQVFPSPASKSYHPALAMFVLYAILFAVMGEHDFLGVRDAAAKEKQAQAHDRATVAQVVRELDQNRDDLVRIARTIASDDGLEDLLNKIQKERDRLASTNGLDSKDAITINNRIKDRIKIEMDRLAESKPEILNTTATGPRNSLADATKTSRDRVMKKHVDDAIKAISDVTRRMLPKNTENTISEKEMGALADTLRSLGDSLAGQPGLQELSDDLNKTAGDLQDMAGMDPEKARKMRELMADVLKGIGEQKQPDLSSLTDEERALLKKIQELMQQMELDEKRLQAMKDAMEKGADVQVMDAEAIKKMLEAMKNPQPDGPEGDSGGTGQGGGDGAAGMAMVPMPSAAGRGASGAAGANTSGGGTQAGDQHTDMRAPPAERKDATFEDLQLRAALLPGETIGEVFVRGDGDKHDITTSYRDAQLDATRRTVEVLPEQLIPPNRKQLVRDYMNRLIGLADKVAAP